MTITVYSKSNCVQCTATTRMLDQNGVTYDTVDLEQDAEALAMVRGMGYNAAPVVVTETDHWCGFNPFKLKGLCVARPAPSSGPGL